MGARYYNATEGRFISPDPFGHAASMDLYSFANGDPVNFVDPTGRGAESSAPTVSSVGDPIGKGVDPAIDWGAAEESLDADVWIHTATPNLPGGQLMEDLGLGHQWIETDSLETGLGNRAGIPGEGGQNSPDLPFSPTYVVDHTGRSEESNVLTSQAISGVDIEALESYMNIGDRVGNWIPCVSDCNTYVNDAIDASTPADLRVIDWNATNRVAPPGSRAADYGVRIYETIPNAVIDSDGTVRPAGTLSN